jgi:hypothetical protein
MKAYEEVATLHNLSTRRNWVTSFTPGPPYPQRKCSHFNWTWGWLCPVTDQFRADYIRVLWCPCWESRFPDPPACSLFSSTTDAILDLPLSIMYLNSSISAYTTKFDATICNKSSLSLIVHLWQACGRLGSHIHKKECLKIIRFLLKKLCVLLLLNLLNRMKKYVITFQCLLRCFYILSVCVQISLNSGKNKEYLSWRPMYVYGNISLISP